MDYISTRNTEKSYSFKDVFLNGLSVEGGLYVPKNIPVYSRDELKKLRQLSYNDLAVKIIMSFCSDEFSKKEIVEMTNRSYKNFRVKDTVSIKKLGKINLVELFHGPTLAFKDIAMQLIGNMYEKILENENKKINIIVATSGDTGAAAISAIKNRKNMKIFVLHPDDKISKIQRKFMTTSQADNVFNLAINGNFDDCQQFVKNMFKDEKFKNSINMSGVNSINWARIIFQIVYYFFSYFRVSNLDEKINFSVPTGNFGDIYSGYIAKKMGLPIDKLIIATNKNDILKRAIHTGIYKRSSVFKTISPSMDIQVASNFERLIFDMSLYNASKTIELMKNFEEKGELHLEKKMLEKIQEDFLSESISEEETKLIIKKIYKNYQMLIDPHTAIGVGVLEKITQKGKAAVLATAHPSKFNDTVFEATGIKPELPHSLENILNIEEKYVKLPKDLNKVKNYITERS